MYWPTGVAKTFKTPSPLNKEPILHLRQNRKGNFFASVSKSTLGVWDVRPTVLQCALVRTAKSLERWGTNEDVIWAQDGRGIIIITSTSHLLFYQLQPSSKPAYDSPSTPLFPPSGGPGEGDILMGWTLKSLGVAFIMGQPQSLTASQHSLLITLSQPPSLLKVPYPPPIQLLAPPNSHYPPPPLDGDGEEQVECEVWDLTSGKEWLGYDQDAGGEEQGAGKREPPIPIWWSSHKTPGLPVQHVMIGDDGKVWSMHTINPNQQFRTDPNAATSSPHDPAMRNTSRTAPDTSSGSKYIGQPIHPAKNKMTDFKNGIQALGLYDESTPSHDFDKAVQTAMNSRFSLIAVGTASGLVNIVSLPAYPAAPAPSHTYDLKLSANLRTSPGSVTSLSWTSDGYALAVGYEHAWAVWSMGGRLGGWGMSLSDSDGVKEGFSEGVIDLFWAPGNVELFILAHSTQQLYAIPFAKSATTGQHSPDNTRYAFLQTDDKVLVYRGADQPDMSVINPESDAWQYIQIPTDYMSTNWPIRYASISSDGKLIAIAGRRGLTHYSSTSGRWKLFDDERQERGFVVRGGLLWFHHVLIAAVDVDKSYQIRFYSRDLDLEDSKIIHSQILPSYVVAMTLLDNSLLVYTAENTLYHFLILPTADNIRIHLCGSISFFGIIPLPSRVRALSWLIPEAQKHLGDPSDDLLIATIIFLFDGKLMLLRPRRARDEEVRYDMQVLANNIEMYYTHLNGVDTLENSLWGYDGKGMRVWLDALTIEGTRVEEGGDNYEHVTESIYTKLDFYPLSILMDKGIIIGVDHETSTRSLPFSLFKLQTGTHLFLPQFMRYHLTQSSLPPTQALHQAISFSLNYSNIIYFAHSLEVFLHSILEDEYDERESEDKEGKTGLPLVIEFLDHFDQSLDVVVSCARKSEVERWKMLFDVVGKPRELFERCLDSGKLKTAAGYLLVLQNLEELDNSKDVVRLLKLAIAAKEYHLCKELLRFLHSIDESGRALRKAINEVEILQTKDSVPQINIDILSEAQVR